MLIDLGDGTYIDEWTPPDVSYGDKPTQAELDAVTEAQGEAAREADKVAMASEMLSRDHVSAAIVEVLSSVASEDVEAEVLDAIKAKL